MNYADPLDKAQDEAQRLIDCALSNRPIYSGESSIYCNACCEPIPQARREAVKGCNLCIDCKVIEDKKGRLNV